MHFRRFTLAMGIFGLSIFLFGCALMMIGRAMGLELRPEAPAGIACIGVFSLIFLRWSEGRFP